MPFIITAFKMIGAAASSFFWGAVTLGVFLAITVIGVTVSIAYLIKVFS